MLACNAAQAQGSAQTPPAAHASAAQVGTEEIRDIRGPKPLGGGWTIPVMVLAGLLTGAAAYGTWFWSRRRGREAPSPLELALARLAGAQRLIDAGSGREFSIEVSDAVRDYIGRQFQIQAAHRTTDEFLHDLVHTSHRALAEHRGNLAGFLEICDLAKFGGWQLTAAEMEQLRGGAVRFVTESASSTAEPVLDKGALTPTTGGVSHVAFPST